MKKFLSVLLALIMALSFAACGQTLSADTPAPDTAEPTASAAPAPADTYPVQGEWASSVTVTTIDELLAAIASDTAVYLAPGDYNLSHASDYGAQNTPAAYSWVEVFSNVDAGEPRAYELQITGVNNLALIAADSADDARPTISAVPRYANVLYFSSCSDIALWGLTLGHTEAPGECSGGVVMFDNVTDAQINSCRLYGCGTVGILTMYSSHISAEGTHIFDCSYSAVDAYSSSDLTLNHCEIYDCGITGFDGVFSVSGTNGFALVNSSIYDCSGAALVSASASRAVSLLGCSVYGDTAFEQALFSILGEDITVDNSAFDSPYYPALYTDYSDAAARTLAGEELTASILAHMERVESDRPVLSSVPEVALNVTVEEGIRYVHALSVDELLAAIAPDTVIYLDSPLYDLSEASSYGGYGGDYYTWLSEYDGPGLSITGVDNLSLISENGAEIVAHPRYVDVVRFSNCSNLSLSGLTLGHTEAPGACSGNVVGLYGCSDVALDACRLYGCGVVGIYAVETDNLNVANTEIYDCSNSAVNMYTVSGAQLNNCNIHDCGTPQIHLFDSADVYYNSQTLPAASYSAYTVTEQGIEVFVDEEMKDLWYSSGDLHIYRDGIEIRDLTLHLGDEVTLTAAYSDGTPAENAFWSWTYGRYENEGYVTETLSDKTPDDGTGFTLKVDKTYPGGTQLLVSDGTGDNAPYCNMVVNVNVLD